MGFWTGVFGSFIDQLGDFAIEQYQEAKIASSIGEAISEMSKMPVNDGQESIFKDYIEPAFLNIDVDPDNCNPEQVYREIPGEYLEFIGGIIEVGIDIINQTLDEVNAEREAQGFEFL